MSVEKDPNQGPPMHVVVFTNGMAMVFDKYGRQIPHLQGYWHEMKAEIEAERTPETIIEGAHWGPTGIYKLDCIPQPIHPAPAAREEFDPEKFLSFRGSMDICKPGESAADAVQRIREENAAREEGE